MQLYMLDTDICSYILKEKPFQVRSKFKQFSMDQLCLSIVTYAELLYGVKKNNTQRVDRSIIESFVRHLSILEWNLEAADHYSDIRVELENQGSVIGNMDMMIAAHARSYEAILVTNNLKHFERISDLRIENWV